MNIDIIDIDTVDASTVRIDGVEFAKADCAVSAYGSQHAQIVADGTTFIASHGSAVNGYRPRGQTALVHAIDALLNPAAEITFTQSGTGSVARSLPAKLRDSVSVKDFGAVGDGVADDTEAIQAALNSAKRVSAPEGTYKITATLSVPQYAEFSGAGTNATGIVISADVTGMVMAQYSRVRGFKVTKSGTHTKNGIEVGSASLNGGRSAIQDIWVDGVGNDGIQVVNGNLGAIRDVVCTANGRDGINFTTDTADNNAWRLGGFLDLRSNVRDGLHLAMGASKSDVNAPKSISGDLVVAQNNGRYGVYVGTRSNVMTIYSEANTTAQVYLDTHAWGNEIRTVEGSVTDSSASPLSNIVQNFNAGADYTRVFQNKTVFTGGADKGIRISNNDGTAGYMDVEKTAVREITHKFAGSGAAWTVKWQNTSTGGVNGQFGGNFSPLTDATYTLGTSSLRWSEAYISKIVLKPAASVTPAANGDLVFEATSNTTITVKLKGSDGTVRSGTITLS